MRNVIFPLITLAHKAEDVLCTLPVVGRTSLDRGEGVNIRVVEETVRNYRIAFGADVIPRLRSNSNVDSLPIHGSGSRLDVDRIH